MKPTSRLQRLSVSVLRYHGKIEHGTLDEALGKNVLWRVEVRRFRASPAQSSPSSNHDNLLPSSLSDFSANLGAMVASALYSMEHQLQLLLVHETNSQEVTSVRLTIAGRPWRMRQIRRDGLLNRSSSSVPSPPEQLVAFPPSKLGPCTGSP